MRGLKRTGTRLASAGLILILVWGCTSREDHEKVVSELRKKDEALSKARAELDASREKIHDGIADLARAMAQLERQKIKLSEMEKSLSQSRDQLTRILGAHEKEKQLMRAELAGEQNRARYLKQSQEELIQGLERISSDLDTTRVANELLKVEVNKLNNETNRLKEILERERKK